MKLNRRRAVSLGLAGLASSALVPLRVEALSRQPLSPENEALYLETCSTSHASYHAELISEVTRMMEQEAVGTSNETLDAVLASISCPLCGCSLDKANN